MHKLAAVAPFLFLATQAAAVTVGFEYFSLGDGPDFYGPLVYGPLESSTGYEFLGASTPGPIPNGILAEIVTGTSGSNSLQAFNGFNGQDGYGAQAFISMARQDNGAFAIHSLDLLLAGCAGGGVSCSGSESITGTLAGGGSADLSVVVGTGDWLNLVSVTFSATGDGFGFGSGTVVEIDNISVSTVPVPAAVWLFGSALVGLGWLRRKQTV